MIFDTIILDDLDEELTKEELCQKHNKQYYQKQGDFYGEKFLLDD